MSSGAEVIAHGGRAVSAQRDTAGRAWRLALLIIATAALLPFTPSLPLHDLSPPLLGTLHVVVKMLGGAIALAISLLTWNTRRGQPLNFGLAGFAVFTVAVLGAGHAAWSEAMRLPGVVNQLAYIAMLLADASKSSVVELPSHSALAGLLGTRRESIARALRKLDGEGGIRRLERKRCEVHRSHLLARLSQASSGERK